MEMEAAEAPSPAKSTRSTKSRSATLLDKMTRQSLEDHFKWRTISRKTLAALFAYLGDSEWYGDPNRKPKGVLTVDRGYCLDRAVSKVLEAMATNEHYETPTQELISPYLS